MLSHDGADVEARHDAHLAKPTITLSAKTAHRFRFSACASSISFGSPIKGRCEDDRGAMRRLTCVPIDGEAAAVMLRARATAILSTLCLNCSPRAR